MLGIDRSYPVMAKFSKNYNDAKLALTVPSSNCIFQTSTEYIMMLKESVFFNQPCHDTKKTRNKSTLMVLRTSEKSNSLSKTEIARVGYRDVNVLGSVQVHG